jgi:tyrosine-protein kinase Etk/Wzc
MEAGRTGILKPNDNVITVLWAKYFPFWPLFAILIVLAVATASFYKKINPPLFESTATILVKDGKKGIEDSKMTESLNILSSNKIIENEIEVFKSRALIGKVVTQLQLYAPMYEKRSWIDQPAYSTSPVKIELRNPDSLVELKMIDFSYDANRSEINVQGQSFPLNQWVTSPWGDIKFTKTNRPQESKKGLYFDLVHPKRVVQTLQRKIEALPSGKLSSIINLSLKDIEPQRSEDILNVLLTSYDNATLTDRNLLAQNTLSFLDNRLQYLATDLDSIEKQIQQYKANKGAIDLSSQSRLFLEKVSVNDQKISDLNMKLSVLSQVEQYILSNNKKGGLVPSTVGIEDVQLTSLLNKLYDSELEYERLKGTTGENNPKLTSLSDQIEKIKPGILENVRSQQESLKANKTNLITTNNTYSSLLSSLPKQERDLVEIGREQNIKNAIYSFLLQKREETALSHLSTLSDTRIVDKAESSLEPVGLKQPFIYMIAVLIAVFAGIIIITIRELFSRTILFRKEIESITNFPVIGEIAMEKTKTSLVIEEGKGTFIAEEFRMLRTTVLKLENNNIGKNILITSAIPGEGKSFIASNLAMSLAISGKKVILLEFDLTNPTLSAKLEIPAGLGIADYLSGNASSDEVIRSTKINPKLFIVTAGTLPRNPSELILNDNTAKLLETVKNRFDYVIIDSAPVGIVSDGYILSRFCDATIYVVRHKHTPKKMLERLDHNTKINELKNLAIVFNGVRTRGFGRYEYGYGYDYSYSKK